MDFNVVINFAREPGMATYKHPGLSCRRSFSESRQRAGVVPVGISRKK